MTDSRGGDGPNGERSRGGGAREDQGHLTIMLNPDRGQASRTFRLSYGRVRLLVGALVVGGLVLTLMAGSWWYLAARATRVGELEREVTRLEAQEERIGDLARQLEEVERRYEMVRGMFGRAPDANPSNVWLPPAGGSRPSTGRRVGSSTLPESWPLTERGFVTQGLLDAEMEHPGLDIAVPTDSYIRAAGGGMVVDGGADPVYGHFVVIDHRDGYSTLYAHASMILVERGQRVRQNEVIALSGSSGRSTAPHLHFEILLNGEAVDPLSMVTQP